jgi:hypothetical protein
MKQSPAPAGAADSDTREGRIRLLAHEQGLGLERAPGYVGVARHYYLVSGQRVLGSGSQGLTLAQAEAYLRCGSRGDDVRS